MSTNKLYGLVVNLPIYLYNKKQPKRVLDLARNNTTVEHREFDDVTEEERCWVWYKEGAGLHLCKEDRKPAKYQPTIIVGRDGNNVKYGVGLTNISWKIENIGDGWYKLRDLNDNKVMHGSKSSRDVYFEEDDDQDQKKWKIEPAGWEFEAEIITIKYDEAKFPKSNIRKQLISEQVYNNQGNSEMSQEVSFSRAFSQSDMLSLTNTSKIGLSVSVKGGVPGFGEMTATTSTEFSLSTTKAQTISEGKTVTIKQTIKVPPHSRLKAFGYADVSEEAEMGFTMKVQVSCNTNTGYLDGKRLKEVMLLSDPDCKVIKEEPEAIVVEFKGNWKGAYVAKSYFETKDLTESESLLTT